MIQEDIFIKWLDAESEKIVEKLQQNQALDVEDKLVMVLKAQSNHFYHLDIELREEMRLLRKEEQERAEESNKRFEQIEKHFEQVDKRIEQVETRIEQVETRIEQVETRIEQVETRIIQVDKRIERLDQKFFHFMIWSFGFTALIAGVIIGVLKLT